MATDRSMERRSGSWCGVASSTTLSPDIKRGPWTPEEDQKLLAFIQQHGHGSWRSLPQKAGLKRCGKSCRLRWRNYLRPDIKRGNFSLHEDQTIIQLHALLGNRWSVIAAHLPKRTDNEIKNYWNTCLKKRLAKIGFDPVTHKPIKAAILGSADADPKNTANLSHIAQWERARLQAEARFVRESKLRTQQHGHSYNNIYPHVSASGHLLYHDQTATTHDHFAPPAPAPPQCLDILRAWETLWSKSRAVGNGGKEGGGAATEGQYGNYPLGDHDVNIVGFRGCDHFEPPMMDNSSGAVMSTTAGSQLDFSEVLGQCGNSEYCSENFAALNHYSMMGFEVGDACITSEQCNINGAENVISEIWA